MYKLQHAHVYKKILISLHWLLNHFTVETQQDGLPEDTQIIYRVAQKSKPLSRIIIKSY